MSLLPSQMGAEILRPAGGGWVDSSGRPRDPRELSAIVLPEGVRGRGVGVVEFPDSGAVYEWFLERVGDRFVVEIGRQIQ